MHSTLGEKLPLASEISAGAPWRCSSLTLVSRMRHGARKRRWVRSMVDASPILHTVTLCFNGEEFSADVNDAMLDDLGATIVGAGVRNLGLDKISRVSSEAMQRFCSQGSKGGRKGGQASLNAKRHAEKPETSIYRPGGERREVWHLGLRRKMVGRFLVDGAMENEPRLGVNCRRLTCSRSSSHDDLACTIATSPRAIVGKTVLYCHVLYYFTAPTIDRY